MTVSWHKNIVSFFKGYYNLPCAVYSIGIYLFIKQAAAKIKSQKTIKFFSYLQGYTFPIYLIHRYYLDVFEKNLHLINLERASLVYVVSATILALILSVLTTMILRKLPVLRHIVPQFLMVYKSKKTMQYIRKGALTKVRCPFCV